MAQTTRVLEKRNKATLALLHGCVFHSRIASINPSISFFMVSRMARALDVEPHEPHERPWDSGALHCLYTLNSLNGNQ